MQLTGIQHGGTKFEVNTSKIIDLKEIQDYADMSGMETMRERVRWRVYLVV
jgi:hypothetical protein